MKTGRKFCSAAVCWALFSSVVAGTGENLLSGYGNMVQTRELQTVRELAKLRREHRAVILSREHGAADYVAEVTEKWRKLLGNAPPMTELQAESRGWVVRNGIMVERVRFSGRENEWITANFYLPENFTEPLPGVVVFCGHTADGKIGYQCIGFEFARAGFATLVVDPLGQGERREYWKADPSGIVPTGAVYEHLQFGSKLTLLGQNLAAWMAADGKRCIDYIVSREEVAKEKIAITGTSGGGTQTALTAALDRRPELVMPSCYITTMEHNIENENAVDSEQIIPGMLRELLEIGDLLVPCVPYSEVVILSQDNDFFDLRGTREAYQELQELFLANNCPEKIVLEEAQGDHGYSSRHRKLAVKHLNRVFGTSGVWQEQQDDEKFSPEELNFYPEGRQFGTPVNDAIATMARNAKFSEENGSIAALCSAIGNPEKMTVPEYRILRTMFPGDDPAYYVNRFALEEESGEVVAILSLPADRYFFQIPEADEVILSIPDFAEEPFRREIFEKKGRDKTIPCYMITPRGIGECRSRSGWPYEKEAFTPYGTAYFHAATGILTGKMLVTDMTEDVLRAIALLRSKGAKKIHIHGKGQGALLAIYAASANPEGIISLNLEALPGSFADLAQAHFITVPYVVLPNGIIGKSDLPFILDELKQTITINVANKGE